MERMWSSWLFRVACRDRGQKVDIHLPNALQEPGCGVTRRREAGPISNKDIERIREIRIGVLDNVATVSC
jgi:hypothetical protein